MPMSLLKRKYLMVNKEKKLFCAKAPLRLGLAGGGSDLSPFSEKYGGCILNATINLFVHVFIEPTNDNLISFEATDIRNNFTINSIKELELEGELLIHKAVYNRIIREFKLKALSFKLFSYADSPVGSGLGTSSTLVVALITAYNEWLDLGLGQYDIAKLAFQIERIDLGFSGGKQDQYAAAFGGFNFMEFGPDEKVLINPLRPQNWILNQLEASIVLYFSGKSRLSSKIISSQIDAITLDHNKELQEMFKIKDSAIKMKSALLKGEFDNFSDILKSSWEAKKSLSSLITNNFLTDIYDSAIEAGALSGKITGAGGGGFFIFCVKPINRNNVIEKLNEFNGYAINFNFHLRGSESWNVCNYYD